jgi:hypothetical protein
MSPAEAARAHCDPADDPCLAVRKYVEPVARLAAEAKAEAADAKTTACDALDRIKSLDARVWAILAAVALGLVMQILKG